MLFPNGSRYNNTGGTLNNKMKLSDSPKLELNDEKLSGPEWILKVFKFKISPLLSAIKVNEEVLRASRSLSKHDKMDNPYLGVDSLNTCKSTLDDTLAIDINHQKRPLLVTFQASGFGHIRLLKGLRRHVNQDERSLAIAISFMGDWHYLYTSEFN